MNERNRLVANLVILVPPVTDEQSKFIIRFWIRYRYDGPSHNIESSEPTGRSVHQGGWVVIVGSNLILHLHFVSPIGIRRNRAIGSQYSIFPRTLSLFDTVPSLAINQTTNLKSLFGTAIFSRDNMIGPCSGRFC